MSYNIGMEEELKHTSVFMRTDLIVKQNVIVSSVLQFFVCMKFFMENG